MKDIKPQKRGSKTPYIVLICVLLAAVIVTGGLYWFKFNDSGSPEESNDTNAVYHTAKIVQYFRNAKDLEGIILLQNDTELRPSGGFITAIGSFNISDSHISNLKVEAGRAFEKNQTLQPPLPAAYAKFITTPYLTLKDANLSPDFATSANNVIKLYENVRFSRPTLVLAINTSANEELLELTGPVQFTVNSHEITLDNDNVTAELERLTDLDFATLGLTEENRKEILSAYAQALLPKLQGLIKEHPLTMLKLAQGLIKNYDLQIWSADPNLQEHLAALHTAQRIEAHPGYDSLMIIDTNLSSRKTDPYIEQEAEYSVDVQKNEALLSIDYKNTAIEAPLTTDYNNFIHIYVPLGSELLNTKNLKDVVIKEEGGRTVISGLFTVKIGDSTHIEFNYRLPENLYSSEAANFVLAYDRQSGGHKFPINYITYVEDQQASVRFDSNKDQFINIENPRVVR